MTEREWLAGADPEPMLAALGYSVSERKLALFAAGCCRRVEQVMRDGRSRRAVELAERRAEGLTTEAELREARQGARAAVQRWRRAGRWGTGADLAVLWAHQAAALALTRPARAPRWAALAAAQAETVAARGQARSQLVGA